MNGKQISPGLHDEGSCRWFNTAWPVQVNPDGSVPIVDHRGDEKLFTNLVPDEAQERMLAGLQKQYEAEQKPGAEVRNPRAPQ